MMKIINKSIPSVLINKINYIKEIYGENSNEYKIFKNGITNTWQTTIEMDNDETFVITGDIPAMWNRDSVAQVRPFLHFVNEDEEIKKMIKGVINIQKKQILIDPYANAFNKNPTGPGYHCDDITEMHDMVWERKYELDSLCYPIQLSYLYYKQTNDTSIFDDKYLEMLKQIYETVLTEQQHHEKSPYSFRRIADWLLFDEPERIKYETLPNKGKGSECGYTKMSWSGFTPSDDACTYGYLIPANMFAVVVLKYAAEIVNIIYKNTEFSKQLTKLSIEIDEGIKEFGIINNEKYGKVYAYQVDGLGNYLLCDDANVPSLLAAPYLGYCDIDDEVYLNTRKMLLSEDNPNYYKGKYGSGIGSTHSLENCIWPISLSIQGLTATSKSEKESILNILNTTHDDTHMMHESFNVNDPSVYTRPWFSWANSMYVEFLLSLTDKTLLDKVKEKNGK